MLLFWLIASPRLGGFLGYAFALADSFPLDNHKRLCYTMCMKCPHCKKNIPDKQIAKALASKGGSVSSEAKRKAALEREARKRKEKENAG